MIEVDQVDFRYPGAGRDALSGVSLTVAEGSHVALLGANGSGKSTLARLLAGLDTPDAGSIRVDGVDTSDPAGRKRLRRSLQVVFQNPENQAVGATVAEDLAFGLANFGTPRDEFDGRIAAILDAVGWRGVEDRPIHRLSAGKKQKLALASVLILEPRHLVLDEPTAFLDPRSRREFLETLDAVRAARPVTVVHITHRLREVLHADRWLVFRNGRLEGDRTPREWLDAGTLDTFGLEGPYEERFRRALAAAGIVG